MNDRRTHLKNRELKLIYETLTGKLSHSELAIKLGRTRTNTYYYIGRAVAYWLSLGVLRFKRGLTAEDLGGRDVELGKEEDTL